MPLTIELTPEMETRVREYAARIGKPAEEVGQIALFRFIHNPDRVPMPWELTDAEREQKREAGEQYLRRMQEQAANATPEEVAQSESDWETLKLGLNENRRVTGERLIFPE